MEIVIGAVIGALAVIVAAGLTYAATIRAQREERDAAAKLERERWQREGVARAEDLDRRRRERWLADTREVCARFIRYAEVSARGSVGADPTVRSREDVFRALGEAWQAVAELELLAPDLAAPTTALISAVLALTLELDASGEGAAASRAPLMAAYGDASQAFKAAAQRHLTGEGAG